MVSRFDNRLNSVQRKFSGKSLVGCLKESGSRGGSEVKEANGSSCSILRPFSYLIFSGISELSKISLTEDASYNSSGALRTGINIKVTETSTCCCLLSM